MRFSLFCLAFIFSFTGYSQGINFQNLTFEAAKDLAIKNKKNLFVDVYIEQCAPCKNLDEKVFVNVQFGQLMNDNFIAIRINPTQKENKAFQSVFNISSYPTLLFFDLQSSLVNSVKGYKDADYLIDIANDVIHPEKSELILAQSKYKEGNRDKSFLQEYIRILTKRDLDAKSIAGEYVDLYEIQLGNKTELEILLFAQLLHSNKQMVKLLDPKNDYSKYDQIIFTKIIRQLIDLTIKNAIDKKDYGIVEQFQLVIFPVYKSVIDPTISEEKLSKHLRTKFEDQLFWGKGVARPFTGVN